MNVFAAPVLLGAGLVSAPAFWGAFVDGTTDPQTALVRFMVSAALVWAGLSVVGMLVGPAPRRVPADASGVLDDAVAEPASEPAG